MGRWAQARRRGSVKSAGPLPIIPFNFVDLQQVGSRTLEVSWDISIPIDNVRLSLIRTSDNAILSTIDVGGLQSDFHDWPLLTIGTAYYNTVTAQRAGYQDTMQTTPSVTVTF